MTAIQKVIKHFRTQRLLADELGITQAAVGKWKTQNKIPAERCLKLQQLTGISVHEMRPDVFGESPE